MKFDDIMVEADKAGKAAAAATKPTPMVVSGHGKQYYVPEGVCGFAWVHFAGNTEFGRWAKKHHYASKDYPNGLSIWVSDYNQSMELKLAYASAFAGVLNRHGIEAYAQSRMD